MRPSTRFEIILDDAVISHFAAIDRKDHLLILASIEQQLGYEPAALTRNRKPLRIPDMVNASWELRCGAGNRYRVFYDVDVEGRRVVVLAVGKKQGSRLIIGREEFDL